MPDPIEGFSKTLLCIDVIIIDRGISHIIFFNRSRHTKAYVFNPFMENHFHVSTRPEFALMTSDILKEDFVIFVRDDFPANDNWNSRCYFGSADKYNEKTKILD